MNANDPMWQEIQREQQEAFAAEQQKRLNALRGEVFAPIVNEVANRNTFNGFLWFVVVVALLIHGVMRYF